MYAIRSYYDRADQIRAEIAGELKMCCGEKTLSFVECDRVGDDTADIMTDVMDGVKFRRNNFV